MLRMAVELSLTASDSQKSFYVQQAVIYLKHFCRFKNSLNDPNTGSHW